MSCLDLRVTRARPVLSDGRHHSSPSIAALEEPRIVCQTATDHLSSDATVSVLRPEDSELQHWEVSETIQPPIPQYHLRDPCIVEFDDRLLVYVDGTSDDHRTGSQNPIPVVAVSDGDAFGEPQRLTGIPEHHRMSYDIVEHDGKLYTTAGTREAGDKPSLYATDDGFEWEHVGTFPTPGNEVALDFGEDGRLWALVRSAVGPCPVVCVADPPYDSFGSTAEGGGVAGRVVLKRLQGPFIKRLRGGLVIIGREYDLYGGGKHNTTTNIWWRPDDRDPSLVRSLPSGGDTSYADWLETEPGRALVPYYTGHTYRMDLPHEDDHRFEESRAYAEQNSPADIYLADISYPENRAI